MMMHINSRKIILALFNSGSHYKNWQTSESTLLYWVQQMVERGVSQTLATIEFAWQLMIFSPHLFTE